MWSRQYQCNWQGKWLCPFFCELQDSEVTQGNVGLKSVGERCFGEMVSRGHEDFNDIVDVFY